MRVGEHEHRVLAAELDRHLLLARDAFARDDAPDRGRAGEEDLVDRRLGERDAGGGAAVDDAHEPLRQARAREHARDPLAREAGRAAGLKATPLPASSAPAICPSGCANGALPAPITPTTP